MVSSGLPESRERRETGDFLAPRVDPDPRERLVCLEELVLSALLVLLV